MNLKLLKKSYLRVGAKAQRLAFTLPTLLPWVLFFAFQLLSNDFENVNVLAEENRQSVDHDLRTHLGLETSRTKCILKLDVGGKT
jgi:hypothetical protein